MGEHVLDQTKIRELYEAGYPDTRIANELSVHRSTVLRWRAENHLKPNYSPGKTASGGRKASEIDEKAVCALLEAGGSTSLTARKTDTYDGRIDTLRRKHAIDNPYSKTLPEEEMAAAWKDGCHDAEIARRASELIVLHPLGIRCVTIESDNDTSNGIIRIEKSFASCTTRCNDVYHIVQRYTVFYIRPVQM